MVICWSNRRPQERDERCINPFKLEVFAHVRFWKNVLWDLHFLGKVVKNLHFLEKGY